MKKLFSIILITSLITVLNGCEKLNESDKSINTKSLNEVTTIGNIALFNKGLSTIPDFGKYLSGTGADEISSIDLTGNQITVLDGEKFEIFKNLKELNLSFNKIENIKNLDKLNNLKILYLVQNSIVKIDGFKNLKKLQILDLSFNQIKDINELGSLKNLSSINLAHNNIENINSLSGLNNLVKLKIEFNKISDISSLINNKNIKVFTISNNNLPDSLVKELNEMSLKSMDLIKE